MAQGLSNASIAEKIYLTLGATENISTSIFNKLHIDHNCHRRVVAVLAWQKEHEVTT